MIERLADDHAHARRANGGTGPCNIRAVTHCRHSADDIDSTLAIVRDVLSGAS